MPLAQSAAILPGVSEPSSVVRSMQRIARSSAQSFDDFLIDLLARAAARSSAPTWSTLRTPRISDPRCERDRAVATCELCDGSTYGLDAPPRPPIALLAARLRSRLHRCRPSSPGGRDLRDRGPGDRAAGRADRGIDGAGGDPDRPARGRPAERLLRQP